jgi:hypothetical protein
MGASTVKEESLSEEPEHEPSVIDTIIQYQNTEQSVNDDPNGTLQQTHNTEESISDDPQEPRQELTRALRVQGLPDPKVSKTNSWIYLQVDSFQIYVLFP